MSESQFLMSELSDELLKVDYANLSLLSCFEKLRAQKIEKVDRLLPDVVPEITEILGGGLRRRLNEFTPSNDSPIPVAMQQELLDKLQAGFEPGFLYSDVFVIHLGMDMHRAALDAAVLIGLITEQWRDRFIELATRESDRWPGLTLLDVVKVKAPELIDGQWHELEETSAQMVQLHLESRPPEATVVIVQVQDMAGEWCRGTTIVVESATPYYAPIPYHGFSRKVRWSCEYVLGGQVMVV